MNTQAACCSPKAFPIQFDLPKKETNALPIVIIGAGPVGLATAAHLAKAGEKFRVLEAGTSIGHHVSQWGHVRLFSPWQYNIDKVARELLEQSGWEAPSDEELPTGKELVDQYLMKLAELPAIQPFIQLHTRVLGISRKGQDKMKTAGRGNLPFVLYLEENGETTQRIEAKAIIDATGTWGQPNSLSAGGITTKNEEKLSQHIYYGIPDVQGKDRERFTGKQIAVVGGGHSAINTILELAELPDSKITWILRKNNVEDAYGGEANDALQARGELGSRIHQLVDSGQVDVYTPYRIYDVNRNGETLTLEGEWKEANHSIEGFDEVIVNTGSQPDFSFLREVRLSIDPATESVDALAPLIDPNLHSCGTVRPHGERELRQPEKNFYIVGMKSYGRAPTFLMATGYEQVRSVVAYLTGDFEAAQNVELDLPETGVCSVNLSPNGTQPVAAGSSGCC
ncbi:NAD(P)-binding domain-containing protein (plasmid) [Planococcus glaciei]|uniref:NAD(P)-binding domain-containing protein n=1 Tax=Planococcus glaciei TaxID=459472 RepID=A0A7H8QFU5_9BACL|nr:FAD-dependent oxidoreductase [Planococcus glaciei]QKX52827.1 NAD(P)-binding domain-containing protein [Planococcus glaciei]